MEDRTCKISHLVAPWLSNGPSATAGPCDTTASFRDRICTTVPLHSVVSVNLSPIIPAMDHSIRTAREVMLHMYPNNNIRARCKNLKQKHINQTTVVVEVTSIDLIRLEWYGALMVVLEVEALEGMILSSIKKNNKLSNSMRMQTSTVSMKICHNKWVRRWWIRTWWWEEEKGTLGRIWDQILTLCKMIIPLETVRNNIRSQDWWWCQEWMGKWWTKMGWWILWWWVKETIMEMTMSTFHDLRVYY